MSFVHKKTKVIFLGILVGLTVPGCGSVILVRPDEPLNNDRVYSYEQLNARTAGTPATVVCRDGERYEADSLRIGRDGAYFFDRLAGNRHRVAIQVIASVTRKDYGAGAFTGGVVGALAGIVTGIGVMLITTDDSADSRMGAAVLFLGTTAAGAALGTLFGTLEGSSIEYRFMGSEHTTEMPPHSSIAGAP